tara:strand:+ start:2545 stop:2826 length:282 start_codon:yes stop_codon:yes gene_type:complete
VAVYHTTAANQLRYLNRILIQQLKAHDAFSALTSIRTVLKPPPASLTNPVPPKPKKAPLRISRESAKHLIAVANGLSDAELSKKLRDLARHSE